jgi:hypothetical protein
MPFERLLQLRYLMLVVWLLSALSSNKASVALAAYVTIATNPNGLKVTVDGTIYTAPQTFDWVAGAQHTISAVTPQVSGSTRNIFSSWSNGGAATHVITVLPVNMSYTAMFSTQYLLTTAVSPTTGGSVSLSPSSADGYYNSGTSVQLTASPATGMFFMGWSGDLTGTTNPATIQMTGGRSVTVNFVIPGITILTNPTGLEISVDNLPYTAPQHFHWEVGTLHIVSTLTPQGGGGGSTRWSFGSWTDGGAMTHVITVPPSDANYSAVFTAQYVLTTGGLPPAGGSVSRSPSSADGYYNSGTTVQLTAQPATDYTFERWHGDLSGVANPSTITMSAVRSVTASFVRVSGVDERGESFPETFELLPNFPNPFNPTTVIRYQLPVAREVHLVVLDLLGQRVATLVQGDQEAGYHEVKFDAPTLSSGVYLYRLQAGDFVQTRKLLLLR